MLPEHIRLGNKITSLETGRSYLKYDLYNATADMFYNGRVSENKKAMVYILVDTVRGKTLGFIAACNRSRNGKQYPFFNYYIFEEGGTWLLVNQIAMGFYVLEYRQTIECKNGGNHGE
jgi:hypothetical protein